MDDVISRQAVIDLLLSEPMNEPHYPDWWARKIVDIEPTTAEWVRSGSSRATWSNYICSNCGRIGGAWEKWTPNEDIPNYCKWCGIRMKKGERK